MRKDTPDPSEEGPGILNKEMSGGDGGPVAYQGSHGRMFGNHAYVWTLFRKNDSNYEFR